MTSPKGNPLAAVPAIDALLRRPEAGPLDARYGRAALTRALRDAAEEARRRLAGAGAPPADLAGRLVADAGDSLARRLGGGPRRVLNLTGTVLHTNLGRAPMPQAALEAIRAAAGATDLEFDLRTGRRGERDDHVEGLLRELTGAAAATVVNNNAAALMLALNTLALRKSVPVSRGELIEIGGAFRLPRIMSRAGCRLVEVGTTNRTHPRDYEEAIDARTALLLKVHTSNYVVQGFTASVDEATLAPIARRHDLPLVCDLGSGSLVDLTRYGLPREPTPRDMLEAGVDLVTFSGDKLLGGPQCGIVVGRADLVARLRRNPMKRALRLDKLGIAALAAVLRLYLQPERLVAEVPGLRALARPLAEIAAVADAVGPALAARLDGVASVERVECFSQIGSGALPVETLPSVALALRPIAAGRRPRVRVDDIAAALRGLPVPVIGRIHDGALLLDLRCLEAPAELAGQLEQLDLPGAA